MYKCFPILDIDIYLVMHNIAVITEYSNIFYRVINRIALLK